ncbi:MAG: YlmC/YmxH family sporulation protein [Bacilli bacterium]
MRLSELQAKDIITTDGKIIGNIIDIVINNGIIDYLVVEKSKFIVSMFSTKDELEIKWEQIKTIGDDVILVSIL